MPETCDSHLKTNNQHPGNTYSTPPLVQDFSHQWAKFIYAKSCILTTSSCADKAYFLLLVHMGWIVWWSLELKTRSNQSSCHKTSTSWKQADGCPIACKIGPVGASIEVQLATTCHCHHISLPWIQMTSEGLWTPIVIFGHVYNGPEWSRYGKK